MFPFLKKKKKFEPVCINQQDNDYLADFVYNWNLRYPYDYWYRKKYNIAFNSKQHRDISIFDIAFEKEEEKIFDEINNRRFYKKGDWIDVSKTEEEFMTDQEKIESYKREFSEIDLSQYDDGL